MVFAYPFKQKGLVPTMGSWYASVAQLDSASVFGTEG
jgi:hypothetical protein